MRDAIVIRPAKAVVRSVRVLYRQLERDRAFGKAATLAYATLVGLVPVLMLAFAVLNALAPVIADRSIIERILFDTFLGDIPVVREVLLPGLEHMSLGALGAIGTLGWMWVSARIYMTMEETYSDVFRVRVTRSLWRRFLNFYLVLTAGPVLLSLLVLGTTDVASKIGLAWWDTAMTVLIPIVILVLAIRALPCAQVTWTAAIVGGTVSGFLVEAGTGGFASYFGTFGARDPVLVIYGSLGMIPVFLFWLWLVWVFVLLGVEVAYVTQHFHSLVRAEHEQARALEDRLRVPSLENALDIAGRVACVFQAGQGPISDAALAEQSHIPPARVAFVLEALETSRIVMRAQDGWTIARPPDAIALTEVARGWRQVTSPREAGMDAARDPIEELVDGGLAGTLAEGARRWFGPFE